MSSKLSEKVVGLFAVVVFGLLLGAGVTITVLFLVFICLDTSLAAWEYPTLFVCVAVGLGVVVFLGIVGLGVKLMREPRDGAN